MEETLIGMGVNTQAWTHAQIHIHTQIPAYVQLPALFQPCVPSQPSAHLCHNQAPGPAKIPIDPPVSAETLILTSTKSQENYTHLQLLKMIANACSTYKHYEFTPFFNVL